MIEAFFRPRLPAVRPTSRCCLFFVLQIIAIFKYYIPRTHKICVMKNFVAKSINICRNRTILASIESGRRDLSDNNIRTKMLDNNSVSRGAIFVATERFWRRSKARNEIYPITTPEPNSETVKPVELTI